MFITLMNVLAWLFVIGLGILALMLAGAGLGALIGTLAAATRRGRAPTLKPFRLDQTSQGLREAITAVRSGTIAWYRENGWRAWVFTAIVASVVLLPLFAEMKR